MNRTLPARVLPVLVILLQACAVNAPPAGTATRVEPVVFSGRVVYRGAPVPGATVRLHERSWLPGGGAARTVPCDNEGAFRTEAPPGTYFFDAEGRFDGEKVFAFSGQNPVHLEKGARWIGMKAVPWTGPETVQAPPGSGGVLEGEAVFNGVPVEGAYVYVYGSPGSLFRGMGIVMSPPTGRDGKFAVENLVESDYYIVARHRGAGGMTGPLEKGDLYGFFPANPVYVREGVSTRIRIDMVEKEKPLSYSTLTSGSDMALKGRIVDTAGRPQQGVYAFVYDKKIFGQQRPYGHSGRTGSDGAFAIFLDRPGTYYLGARETFGNPPAPGERFGFYDGTADHSLRVEEGKSTDGLVIVVEKILAEGK